MTLEITFDDEEEGGLKDLTPIEEATPEQSGSSRKRGLNIQFGDDDSGSTSPEGYASPPPTIGSPAFDSLLGGGSRKRIEDNSLWPSIIEAQKPPSIIDQLPGLVTAIKGWEGSASFRSINHTFKAVEDYLGSPEYVNIMENWFSVTTDEGAPDPFLAELKYGVWSEIWGAVHEKYPTMDWDDPSGAFENQQNVGVFYDEAKDLLPVGVKDLTMGIFSSVPTKSSAPAFVRGFKSALKIRPENPREEVADWATQYLRGLIAETEEQNLSSIPDHKLREFSVDLYFEARKRIQEDEADAGWIGGTGALLDAPLNLVQQETGAMINSFAPPDSLNRTHRSPGRSWAALRGLTPNSSATIPEAEIMATVFGAAAAGAEVVESVAIPFTLVGNIAGAGIRTGAELAAEGVEVAAGEEAGTIAASIAGRVPGSIEAAEAIIQDPELFSPIFESLAQGSSYELVSGGVDLSTWIWGDPINYIAGAGFGLKAAKAIPRAENVSRGRALLQAMAPFYGAHATGVNFGITSRVTWALTSKTIDNMVDGMRGTRRGRRLIKTLQRAETVEDAMRSVSGLDGSPRLAAILWDAAKVDDQDFFWEALRGSMYGWNQKDNPVKFDRLRGLLKSVDEEVVVAGRRHLDQGNVGIRDVIHSGFGVVEENPYIVLKGGGAAIDTGAEDFINVDVVRRAEERGPRLATGEVVGVYPIKDGSVEVRRGAKGTYAAFEDGEFVGMVENVSSPNRAVAVPEQQRRRGIGSLLRNIEGPPRPARAQSGSAKLAFGDTSESRILRTSLEKGDGEQKIVVSRKGGWNEAPLVDDQLVSWLSVNGHQQLAAKLEFAYGRDPENLLNLARLTDEETEILRRYADDIAELDGIRHGQELLVSNRGQGKLLRGTDLEETTDIRTVMGDELYREAYAHATSELLGNKSHNMTLVHRMPRAKSYRGFTKGVAKWTGSNAKNRTSQFIRRFKAGLATPLPTEVSFKNIAQGGSEYRNFLRLLGVPQNVVDDIMEGWWRAGTQEDRRKVFINGIETAAESIDHPHLRYSLLDWSNTHGVHSYAKMADGTEIGKAEDVLGYVTVKPVIKAHMETGIDLPNVLHLQRELRRYRFGSKHPRLIAGFGKTNKKREALVEAYTGHIRNKYGAKVLEEIDPDDIMAMAYADVLGYKGREDGLGRVNSMTDLGSRIYGGGQYAFTLGQLAFRPFAWATRVNLEEHARAWMMGVPTIVRFPVQYNISWWDAHFFRVKPKRLVQQRTAATASAVDLFPTGIDASVGLARAEKILPGITKRAEQSLTLDISDPMAVRAFYSHQLAKSLTGGYQALDIGSRGNIAGRVVLRAKQMKAKNQHLSEVYGLAPSFDILDDVPEIVNKSSVFMFADETASSIKDLDWAPNIRAKSITTYGHAYSKKLQQITNDFAGRYAIQRQAERIAGGAVTNTGEQFVRSRYWGDVSANVEDVARARGKLGSFADEAELAEWYLDTIVAEEMIGSLLRPMYTKFAEDGTRYIDTGERLRLIDELANGQALTPWSQGRQHRLRTGNSDYTAAKADYANYFRDVYEDKNFDFPTVAGFFNPLYANEDLPNPFRRFTNWSLQTFGENITQNLHRQPAYLSERRRWRGALKRLGWDETDANAFAHQKAFEMVNYTFFNNQHTGIIAHRLNKAIPFFSAWVEVLSTWAWKIPSQNYLPIGYARMVHRMETIMKGFVKMGLVEVDDEGQWRLQMSDNPVGMTPLGAGMSKAMKSWVETPIAIIEQGANLAQWAKSQFDDSDFRPADFSAWYKDDYELAIGSPTRLNSHGVMGVNQFQFGLAPPLSYATTEVMKRLPFAGDTELINGDTLADAYGQLPTDVSQGEFLSLNERQLKVKFGEDLYNTLFQNGGYLADPASYDISGLDLQVPKSSWYDGMVDDLFFPFGHVETKAGILREIVPSSLSLVLRGSLGVYADESPIAEGILGLVTGQNTMDQYQIDSEIAKQLLHLEATEGLVSESRGIANRIMRMVTLSEWDTVEAFKAGITPGSEESTEFTQLSNDLDTLNHEIMKRATDNAGFALVSRGIMGFFAPATPRMAWEEQRVTSQWYKGREMAEAASQRGSIPWADAINDVDIRDADDMVRLMGIVHGWVEDPSGDSVKSWFLDRYPSLMAWTNSTTFWGPTGPPAQIQDLDEFFVAYGEGLRDVIPADVLIQRVARAGVAGGYESLLKQRFGDDPASQVQAILSSGNEYNEMRDSYRMKLKGLDMWDAELNDGAYIDWRNRNEDDAAVLLEEAEEQYFILNDAGHEILALADISPELDDEQRKDLHTTLGILMREYGDALEEVNALLETDDGTWRNPREQLLYDNLKNVMVPFWEGRSQIYEKINAAESKEEISAGYEELRVYESDAFLQQYTLSHDGTEFAVPPPAEQSWLRLTPEEQQGQVFKWVARPPSWLNLFQTNKLTEYAPQLERYVPQTPEDAEIYAAAAALKNETIKESRENPEAWTSYKRDQRLSDIDDRLLNDLESQGRFDEVVWQEAWPIERLVIAGMLPPELEQVAAWYMGIHSELKAMEKGPGSEPGRDRFLALAQYLDTVYFQQNASAADALDALGLKMFNEDGRYAVYARLYGTSVGELD